MTMPSSANQAMRQMDAAKPSPSSKKARGADCSTQRATVPTGGCAKMAMSAKSGVTVRFNQYAVYSATSGLRGQARVTGPGSLMLMYEKEIAPRNTFRVDLMASAEQFTVGKVGTPQLLQTENLDAMHAHDTIMALEFRDTFKLSTSRTRDLTFLFAPRGAAAVGPVPFMHRPSAEGNPDSPLGHNLQDGFHDVSTVVGVSYRSGRTFVEATGFSGKGVTWPLPLHRPDSFGVRLTQGIYDNANIGASYADVLTPGDAGSPARHERFVSAWLATNHRILAGTLKSSLIWGQLQTSGRAPQNSFLGEAVLQQNSNNFFGRAEALQVTPEQLSLGQFNGSERGRWVEAITVGYERSLLKRGFLSVYAGSSLTKDFVPRSFAGDYGSHLGGAKLFIRLKFDNSGGMSDGM